MGPCLLRHQLMSLHDCRMMLAVPPTAAAASETGKHMQGEMLWRQTSSGASCGCWPRRSRSSPPWVMWQHQVVPWHISPYPALRLSSSDRSCPRF